MISSYKHSYCSGFKDFNHFFRGSRLLNDIQSLTSLDAMFLSPSLTLRATKTRHSLVDASGFLPL